MSTAYTVTQINAYIHNMFTQDYLLRKVYVKGEVSNCKYHSSGHIYFTLKDEKAVLSCVMFAGDRPGLRFRLENGLGVIVMGRVGIYERNGSYQLYAKEIRLDGLGALYERYEALKRELEESGMFDEYYKKPIPRYIRTLGVVTAPTGAAVRDIIQISRRRHPGIRILLCPVQVQGEGSAQSVAAGIELMDEAGVDVIIIGRGGGSIEDLWAFNEEIVARAVFRCRTPIISAVGHETDTVISDYVADLRAPTPSAAAELAVTDMREAAASLQEAALEMERRMRRRIEESRQSLQTRSLKLSMLSPEHRIDTMKLTLDEKERQLTQAVTRRLEQIRSAWMIRRERLMGLSPYDKLAQGWALVTDDQGRRLTGAMQSRIGSQIRVRFSDGTIAARVEQLQAAGGEDAEHAVRDSQ